MALSHSTFKLHATMIRLAKGVLFAWEEWVKANQEPPKVINNPDPVKHFEQHSIQQSERTMVTQQPHHPK